MRKKTNHTALVITGAATAFAGLAGNVQAIPISSQNYSPGLVNTHSIVSSYQGERTYAFQSSGLGNYFTSPIPIQDSQYNSWRWQLASQKFRVHLPAISSAPGSPAPTGAPDGGTTAIMLGGVFCGMVIVGKKLKA